MGCGDLIRKGSIFQHQGVPSTFEFFDFKVLQSNRFKHFNWWEYYKLFRRWCPECTWLAEEGVDVWEFLQYRVYKCLEITVQRLYVSS